MARIVSPNGFTRMVVVAALLRSRTKLLACQRKRGSAFEFKWEFPGGKVRPGESLEAALERELREELAVNARVGHEVYRTHHHYAEMAEPLEVVFFTAEVEAEKIRNCVFERIEWVATEALGELDFLEADRDLIALLASGTLRF
ncbi:MAG: NUDIX domain-containing protein [Acidobacteriota bacterium]|nr:NUDIX domain-containing protein [Acidobacteriota bacterium]MDE3170686.1 NUDIX domain-containing protein [Acidobacteriota bacterium]